MAGKPKKTGRKKPMLTCSYNVNQEEHDEERLMQEVEIACKLLNIDPVAAVASLRARRQKMKDDTKLNETLATMPVDEVVRFIEGESSLDRIANVDQSEKGKRKKKRKKRKQQVQEDAATAAGESGNECDEQQHSDSDECDSRIATSDSESCSNNTNEEELAFLSTPFSCLMHQADEDDSATDDEADCDLIHRNNGGSYSKQQNRKKARGAAPVSETAAATAASSSKKRHSKTVTVSNPSKAEPLSNEYCFEADYCCRLACIDCIASLKANGTVELLAQDGLAMHVCGQSLLLALPKNTTCSNAAEVEWSLVRELPDRRHGDFDACQVCEHVTRGQAWMCTEYPYCNWPHNEVERVAWLKTVAGQLSISQYVARRQCLLSVEDAVANLFSVHRGRFLFACRACFKLGRYAPQARNGLSCEPLLQEPERRGKDLVVRHSWRDNKCLVHCRDDRFARRPLEPLPPPSHADGWQHLVRYSLCEHGLRCAEPQCTNAHTRVELALWRLERIYPGLMQLLVDGNLQSDKVVSPDHDVSFDADRPRAEFSDLDLSADCFDLHNQIDPADILPRDGRKKATLISMALARDDSFESEYGFEVKLTKRELRERRKLDRLERADDKRQEEQLDPVVHDSVATVDSNSTRSNQVEANVVSHSNSQQQIVSNISVEQQPSMQQFFAVQSHGNPTKTVKPTVDPVSAPTSNGANFTWKSIPNSDLVFRLICIDCVDSLTPLGEVDLGVSRKHVCQQTLLAVQNRHANSTRWSLVRYLPTDFPDDSVTQLCEHVIAGRLCPKLLFCEYPHNEEERFLWSRARMGSFDVSVFVNSQRNSHVTMQDAMKSVLREHGGYFLFLCRACYMNPVQRIVAAQSSTGIYCDKENVTHLWTEQACMVHCRSETQFGMRPIESRPLASHNWQHLVRYCLCERGVRCAEPRCINAHTKVELAVWRLERAFPDCTRQMLVSFSTSRRNPPQQQKFNIALNSKASVAQNPDTTCSDLFASQLAMAFAPQTQEQVLTAGPWNWYRGPQIDSVIPSVNFGSTLAHSPQINQLSQMNQL